MSNPLQIIAAINARENGAHRALAPMNPKMQDPDGVWDCDNFAAAKWMAPDWPQGVPSERVDVALPDGQQHRVVLATVGGKQWVLDNLTNALLTKEEREAGGWAFRPKQEERVVEPKGLLSLGQQAPLTPPGAQ